MLTDLSDHRQASTRGLADASTDARASKRARNAFDSSLDASGAPEEFTPTPRKTHNKKQPLSCAECRRCCDRVFPCQSCSKRGCAEICPDGALTSGKGSRFILANTEQLHAKIIQMSDRIRQLEDALETVQAKCTSDPHPLLHQDSLRIKNSLELYSSHATSGRHPQMDGIIKENHASNLQLPVASSSTRDVDKVRDSLSEERYSSAEALTSDVPGLSPEIEKLSQTFPYPWLPNNPMRQRIYEMLPSREEAEYLCTQARLNALWQYNLDPSETWLPNLVHHVYTTPMSSLSFRRLSLLFIMMAIGLLVDLNQQNESPRAEVFHRLARASLCETNLMDEPSFDLLQTLFYMIWYLLIFSDKSQAVSYAWSIMGLAVKLAQSLGLHRDGNRWKAIPEESQRRRMLFWELLNLDARLSLSLGRPPSLCLQHVDCRRPSYVAEGMNIIPGAQSYHEWKHGFFQHCLTPVLVTAISAQPQPYSGILDVDKKIRDFHIPPTLNIFNPEGTRNIRQLTMQQVLVASGREIVLLQLHRNFFTEALSDFDAFTYRHKYAPSVLATYLSASRLVATLGTMLHREPQLSKRFMCFWFNAFSGAVALSLIVSRTPFLSLAPYALKELDSVYRIFANVAEECSKVAQALPLLTKIVEKSRRTYFQWLKASRDSPTMNTDQTFQETPARSAVCSTSGDPASPFDAAHSYLQRTLQDIETTAPPDIQELPAYSPRQPKLVPSSERAGKPEELGHPPDLSTDMLSLALGLNEDLVAATLRHSSDPSTPAGNTAQRVGNHTFNFDFGALGSNVENQNNTYMSWF
ncbi:fungal-specific transcription factor domain-containing protein [Suillus clintonianus]|uniref:fungal-specific transcription factor domain-containing protein n=1 Tax=Suillus clintonianus TaxID=1904413 RepID=UPI001B883043|nr:fungal-specific transcription factor domain-containing protein [Suillus clintonianus]KAG2145884.1 fungal-specific transcription factor domain-containing protein [Suillus clintonianus]